MTEKDSLNDIQKLIETIRNDTSMYPAKRKAVVGSLKDAEISLSISEDDYIKEEAIAGIAGKLTIIFVPLFMIFLAIYGYGIPNVVAKEANLVFFITIASFVIAFSNTMIAPRIYRIQQKIFPTKSA